MCLIHSLASLHFTFKGRACRFQTARVGDELVSAMDKATLRAAVLHAADRQERPGKWLSWLELAIFNYNHPELRVVGHMGYHIIVCYVRMRLLYKDWGVRERGQQI